MPRLYQRTARQDIWQTGFRTPASNKQGFKVDRSIPASTGDNEHQDVLLVKKGQRYFTWHPKGLPWQYSIERPDLRSAWEREIAELEEQVDSIVNSKEDYEDIEEWESNRDAQIESLEERRDELQQSLDNMPEVLQESSILNDRIEALEELINQLNEE